MEQDRTVGASDASLDDGAPDGALDATAAGFRLFAAAEIHALPLYDRLVTASAEDRDLMALMQEAPKGQRRPNLLLAAVHDLLLASPGADELGRWYPTVDASPLAVTEADPFPAFVRFVDDHRSSIVDALRHRATQTNDPNRSCVWFAALRAAVSDIPDRPIAVVELGASAGLNLGFDRYSIDYGDGVVRGAVDSPVRLSSSLVVARPPIDAPLPPIVGRVGLDVSPVDPSDPVDARWLRACVWPEQALRHRRLSAALAVAAADPIEVLQGDAVDDLTATVATLPSDAHLVVVHSWMLTYVRRDRRPLLLDAIDRLGAERDVSYVTAEAPGVVPGVVTPPIPGEPKPELEHSTVVAQSRWRSGRRDDSVLARCHPHGDWIDWFA